MNLLVNLDVDDREKAIHFYGSAFELTVGRRFGTSGVEMLGSSAPIYLLSNPAVRQPQIQLPSAGAMSGIGRQSILILSLRT